MASSADACAKELKIMLSTMRREVNLGLIAILDKTINGMNQDIDKAEHNDYVSSHPDLVKDVRKALNEIIRNLFIRKNNETMMRFFSLYREMVVNWNSLAYDEDVTELLEIQELALNSLSTMRDMIVTMQNLISYSEQLMERTPPIYQVSKHYLDTIQKSLREKKLGGDNNADC